MTSTRPRPRAGRWPLLPGDEAEPFRHRGRYRARIDTLIERVARRRAPTASPSAAARRARGPHRGGAPQARHPLRRERIAALQDEAKKAGVEPLTVSPTGRSLPKAQINEDRRIRDRLRHRYARLSCIGYPGKSVCHGGGWAGAPSCCCAGTAASPSSISAASASASHPHPPPHRARSRAAPGRHRRAAHARALGPHSVNWAALQACPHRHRRQGAGLVGEGALGLHACPRASTSASFKGGARPCTSPSTTRPQCCPASRPHRAGPYAADDLDLCDASGQLQRRDLHRRMRPRTAPSSCAARPT